MEQGGVRYVIYGLTVRTKATRICRIPRGDPRVVQLCPCEFKSHRSISV